MSGLNFDVSTIEHYRVFFLLIFSLICSLIILDLAGRANQFCHLMHTYAGTYYNLLSFAFSLKLIAIAQLI